MALARDAKGDFVHDIMTSIETSAMESYSREQIEINPEYSMRKWKL